MRRSKGKIKIKWKNVIFCLILLIIVMGGIIMFFGEKENIDNNVLDNNNEQEVRDELDDNNVENTDQANSTLDNAPSNSLEYSNLGDGEYLTSKGYTLKIENGIAYVDGHLIVNKTYSIPFDYVPSNPYKNITGDKCNNCINKEVMDAFKLMQSDASSVGLNIYISSGYRSYSYQERLYNNYSAVDGMEEADTYSARAGHSEHQTGLCFDLNEIENSFANTDEGKWVNDNAWFYGFIIRYPKGKESITGYQYESWHLRYVGKDLAEKLYNAGNWVTMEEYYGISSSY